MVIKTCAVAIAVLALLSPLAQADDMLTSVVFSGTWQSVNASDERSLTLQFIDGECVISMKAEHEELSGSGLFQQEETKLYVILRQSVTVEKQLEIPYEVIDSDTVEVTVNRKKFTLVRRR